MLRKHRGKRRNYSLRAISPFPSVFKRLALQTHKNQGLFGTGLNMLLYGESLNILPLPPLDSTHLGFHQLITTLHQQVCGDKQMPKRRFVCETLMPLKQPFFYKGDLDRNT